MSFALDCLVRRPSGKHGDGVYTTQALTRGQAVLQFGGPLLRADQVTDDMRAMQIGPDQYLGETEPAEDFVENFINHSCEPNLGFTDGSVTLHALRDIAQGEELTWDYSTSINEPGWKIPCRCGAKTCRGEIRSFCDLTPAQQQRLMPLALRYLQAPQQR